MSLKAKYKILIARDKKNKMLSLYQTSCEKKEREREREREREERFHRNH